MEWSDPTILVPSFLALNFGMFKWFGARTVNAIDNKLGTIDEIDRRLIQVETALQTRMPCSQYAEHTIATKALHARLDGLTSEVGKLTGTTAGLNRCVDLMNQFLIEQGGKK